MANIKFTGVHKSFGSNKIITDFNLLGKEDEFLVLVADVLILGYMGAMPAEGLYLLIARVATAYYFLHFLVILPVLGFKERTLPVPLSITERYS